MTDENKLNQSFIQRRIVALVLSIAFIILAILLHPLWLPALYSYLDVSRSPREADAIVVLGGGRNRTEHAATLYAEGYAPQVIVSGNFSGSPGNDIATVHERVPRNAVLINDQATNTYDEAEQVLAILLEIDARSALIVTDRSHTRRARATYHHVFSGHEIELTMVSPDDSIEASSWWKTKGVGRIAMEYPKMLYYLIAYGVWSG
jgi:uncharacterized SAM-binding protein YcdF (DUF218 family)